MGRQDARKSSKLWPGLGFGSLIGYIVAQQAWAIWQLANADVERTLNTQANEAPQGRAYSETTETEVYIRSHAVEDGIERIVYLPKKRRYETPIVMQHGMWHGAWCWELWQALLAGWGWETARLPRRPVLMGHSMGGALTQWYLKYVADDLPAAVLVAPWVSHSMFKDGFFTLIAFDPVGALQMMLTWDASPLKRKGPASAVRFLVGPHAAVPLEQLQPRLGPESALVLYQHNPPFWHPPEQVRTPLLWIAGEDDPLLVEAAERRSAAHYEADYIVAAGARHNVMMEHNYRESAERVHTWLAARGIK
jgi:pimeloyl-ACP methyl ester carboxylesterase